MALIGALGVGMLAFYLDRTAFDDFWVATAGLSAMACFALALGYWLWGRLEKRHVAREWKMLITLLAAISVVTGGGAAVLYFSKTSQSLASQKAQAETPRNSNAGTAKELESLQATHSSNGPALKITGGGRNTINMKVYGSDKGAELNDTFENDVTMELRRDRPIAPRSPEIMQLSDQALSQRAERVADKLLSFDPNLRVPPRDYYDKNRRIIPQKWEASAAATSKASDGLRERYNSFVGVEATAIKDELQMRLGITSRDAATGIMPAFYGMPMKLPEAADYLRTLGSKLMAGTRTRHSGSSEN